MPETIGAPRDPRRDQQRRPRQARLEIAADTGESATLPQDAAAALSATALRRLHVIFHIPRCAGQTIHHHLSQHVSSERYFRVPKRRGLGRLVFSKYQVGGMPSPQRLDVVGGHWVGRSIERNFQGRDIVRSILLRDPLCLERIRGDPPATPGLDVLGRKICASDRFLSSFAFVGDHTRCDELIARLAGDLEIPERASLRNTSDQWREHVPWTPLGESDLSPSMIASIRQDNELDQMLWETWRDAGDAPLEPAPHEFAQEARTKRLTRHASRLVNQVRRRVRRRWTGPDASLGSS